MKYSLVSRAHEWSFQVYWFCSLSREWLHISCTSVMLCMASTNACRFLPASRFCYCAMYNVCSRCSCRVERCSCCDVNPYFIAAIHDAFVSLHSPLSVSLLFTDRFCSFCLCLVGLLLSLWQSTLLLLLRWLFETRTMHNTCIRLLVCVCTFVAVVDVVLITYPAWHWLSWDRMKGWLCECVAWVGSGIVTSVVTNGSCLNYCLCDTVKNIFFGI